MSDEDLRGRFRRDFSREPAHRPVYRPAQRPQAPTPKTEPPTPVINAQPATAATPAVALALPAIPEVKVPRRVKRQAKRNKKKIVLIPLLLILLAGGGGGAYWYQSNYLTVPIPASTRSSVDFPLLYPAKLPTGYSLKKSSFTTSNNIVLYEADNGGSRIAFSVQQRPPSFDFNAFYKQSLSNGTTFDTSLGQAAIGQANGHLLGSLTTDQSWLIVSSASQKIQSPDLRLILQNLKLAAVTGQP